MSLLKASLLALCATLLLASRLAFALVEIPPLETRVTDLTGTLSEADKSALEAKLKAFEAHKGAQIAVLMLPSTQPEDIAQFGIRLAEKWQIGRDKSDDGVIVIVAKDDRKMRIEVGYGLEGAIPDVYAKRIISEQMAPHFKQGDFAGGLNATVDSLTKLIEGEALPAPEANRGAVSVGEWLPLLLFGGLVTGLILRSMFGTFFGSLLNGGLVGGLVFLLGMALLGSAFIAIIAFIFTLMLGSRSIGTHSPGGYGGGWSSGGGSWGGGGGWSGGGGDFGGGGASGDW